MAVALDASAPPSVYSDTTTLTALTTASFTPPNGSIVVAKVVTADSACIPGTPTGLTFTSRVTQPASSETYLALSTAAGAGAPVTVSVTFTGTGNPRGLIVEVWTGAQLAATPATHTTSWNGVATGPSDTITTTGTNSVVTWLVGDWTANAGTVTYRSPATQVAYHTLASYYTGYAAYQAAAAAGSQTYGASAPTVTQWDSLAIELQSSGGAVATPPRRPVNASRPAVMRGANY